MVNLYEEENENKHDTSYSIFAIANSLKLAPEDLPAIVVTHDTRLRSFRHYKTCANDMEKQMSRLTSVANKMAAYKQSRELDLVEKQNILYQQLDEQDIDLCKGMGEGKLNESMARALSDILSFLVDGKEADFNQHQVNKIAAMHQKTTITRVIATLQHFKKLISEGQKEIEYHQYFPVVEDLHLKLAIFIKMLHGCENGKDIDFAYNPIKEEWLEESSMKFLKTGLEVASYIGNNPTMDYSASAICLAKMFEQEINYSLVHMVRKQNAIELPKYYNKYQPGVNVLIKPEISANRNPVPIDFNMSRFGKWAPPELGKSKIIAKNNLKESDWYTVGIKNYKQFLKDWDIIHDIRNKTAHTENVKIEDFEKLRGALFNLANNNIFDRLSSLKEEFKVGSV